MKAEDCKRDCFAFRKRKDETVYCDALIEIECEGCSFYKTREQYEKEMSK